MSSNTVGRASRPESRELARKGGSGEFISLFFLVFAERSERLESREKERREATFFSRVLSLLFFFSRALVALEASLFSLSQRLVGRGAQTERGKCGGGWRQRPQKQRKSTHFFLLSSFLVVRLALPQLAPLPLLASFFLLRRRLVLRDHAKHARVVDVLFRPPLLLVEALVEDLWRARRLLGRRQDFQDAAGARHGAGLVPDEAACGERIGRRRRRKKGGKERLS